MNRNFADASFVVSVGNVKNTHHIMGGLLNIDQIVAVLNTLVCYNLFLSYPGAKIWLCMIKECNNYTQLGIFVIQSLNVFAFRVRLMAKTSFQQNHKIKYFHLKMKLKYEKIVRMIFQFLCVNKLLIF